MFKTSIKGEILEANRENIIPMYRHKDGSRFLISNNVSKMALKQFTKGTEKVVNLEFHSKKKIFQKQRQNKVLNIHTNVQIIVTIRHTWTKMLMSGVPAERIKIIVNEILIYTKEWVALEMVTLWMNTQFFYCLILFKR